MTSIRNLKDHISFIKKVRGVRVYDIAVENSFPRIFVLICAERGCKLLISVNFVAVHSLDDSCRNNMLKSFRMNLKNLKSGIWNDATHKGGGNHPRKDT